MTSHNEERSIKEILEELEKILDSDLSSPSSMPKSDTQDKAE